MACTVMAARRIVLQRLVTVLLLVLVAAVSAWRALGLVAEPGRPSAGQERSFMGWAWREPRVVPIFAALEERLPPGRPVRLVVAPKQAHNAQWWRFMATYHLPANPLRGVEVAKLREVSVGGPDAVIFFPAEGEPGVVARGRP